MSDQGQKNETLTSADVGTFVNTISEFEVQRQDGTVQNVEQGEDFQIVDVIRPKDSDDLAQEPEEENVDADGLVIIENDDGDHFHLGYQAFTDSIGDVFELEEEPDVRGIEREEFETAKQRIESKFDAEVHSAEKQGEVKQFNITIEGRSTPDQIAKHLRDFVIGREDQLRVRNEVHGQSSAVYRGRADVMDVSKNKLDTEEGYEQAAQEEALRQKLEELSEDEEESVDVINDLHSINFDQNDEQFQGAELIEGLASQNNEDNEVAMRFFELLDQHLDDIVSTMQDEMEVDFDSVGE